MDSNNKTFINITEDNGVQKHIITEGTGENPSDGLEVEVHYEGRLHPDGKIFDSSKSRGTFKFILGGGQVIKGWDLGVKTMKKGEISEFILQPEYAYGENGAGNSIPANAVLNFEISLLNFYEKPKSKYEMDLPEKLSIAKKAKEEGVVLFQAKSFSQAVEKFEDGYSYLDKLPAKELTTESKDLIVSLLLNSSNCYNNLKKYEATIKKIGEALKIKESAKCYYYRGVAFANLEEFEPAEEDYNNLLKHVPHDDPGVKYLKSLIDEKKANKDKKSKSLYKNMFKSSLYDDKPTAEKPKGIPDEINSNNPRVFFDLKIDNQEPKRVEFELFADKTPKTAENFKQLCLGSVDETGKTIGYKNSVFHRVIKNFMMQGGDFENSNGTGGTSIYGKKFEDENFAYTHSREGLLSMANSGPNTNGSQFFVTFKETPWLDGKHVVFGRVVSGMDVVKEVEQIATGEQDKPEVEVRIVDCGQL